MDSLSYKTKSSNKASVEKNWLLVDVEGQTLGRVCSQIAMLLRGKHKPSYTPNVDCGDYVVVINAEKVRLTGNKWEAKEYIRHTGYPGGQRTRTAKELLAQFPERLVENAVRGMLPKNRLGREIYRNLKVYAGTEHGHQGQDPKVFELDS
jgi:large subunit ribosomal protein L13